MLWSLDVELKVLKNKTSPIESWYTISTVAHLIVKLDGSRYCTSTLGTVRIGYSEYVECVDALLTKSSMSAWHLANFDTRRIKAHITRC
jgi:hypothetical protein